MDVSGQTIDELIFKDLIYAFQSKFGEEWYKHLHTNLKPSPLKEIAIAHGVSLHRVKQHRTKLMTLGLFFRDSFQTENESENEGEE
jgi:hypothetical protein